MFRPWGAAEIDTKNEIRRPSRIGATLAFRQPAQNGSGEGLSAPRRPEPGLALWKNLPEIQPQSDLMTSVAALRSARLYDPCAHVSRFRMA